VVILPQCPFQKIEHTAHREELKDKQLLSNCAVAA
jgi:hypothetical protein